MKKIILTILVLFTTIFSIQAQAQRIDNFMVKENLTQNGKLAIIVIDSTERPVESISGTFVFSLNGFQQDLVFHDGIAVVKHPLESSTFVFFKHKNGQKSIGKLYYVHKADKELKPFKIYGLLLLIIPAAILLVAYLFKRFLAAFAILALIYVYFHYAKGLDLSKILESIFSALKEFL
ncbi:hypothetical protein [Sphingobacterium suaedae]|uniref:Uncharacterized protein n=1 Tax=Sphingobacterium suaedae TaxID=1686402 RepID=A0ABW5KHP6_9SPHI